MDELARLSGRAGGQLIVDDEDLGTRDRLPDRARLAVGERRFEVGAAKRLGEAVHQHQLGAGMGPAQRSHGVLGKPAAGVRQHPQRAQGLGSK
jgi:hypothetical protein